MTGNARSRLEDAKLVSLLVAICLGVGGVAYAVIVWASDVQTKREAISQHESIKIETRGSLEALRLELEQADREILGELKEQNEETNDHLKVLRSRTWELLGKKRNGRDP